MPGYLSRTVAAILAPVESYGGASVSSVLIVVENGPMRRALRCMVADLVQDVYECAVATDAVACYAETRPDWVVLDLAAGGGEGVEATRRIVTAHPAARVVMVGNYDDEDQRAAARSVGAVEYVAAENMLDVRAVLACGPAST